MVNFEHELKLIEEEVSKVAYVSSLEKLGLKRGILLGEKKGRKEGREEGIQKAILVLTLHRRAEIAEQLQLNHAEVESIIRASL